MVGSTLANLRSKPGFWRATNMSAKFHACDPVRAELECIGGPPIPEVSSQCGPGQEGPECSVCKEGYVRKVDKSCGRCAEGESTGTIITMVVVIFLFLPALAVLAHRSRKRIEKIQEAMQKRTMKLRILLGFVQILTRLGMSYTLALPKAVVSFFYVSQCTFAMGEQSIAVCSFNCLSRLIPFLLLLSILVGRCLNRY